jgi:hypothetical protein
VATTTSVTLSGGAPTVVDGVTLILNDRVLVRSQASGAQNGIYRVSVLGTGANGTWVRTLDADTADKLSPGTSLSIEEGTTLAGKLYRMTSTNPITLGSTAITWTDVSGGGGSAGGNDGQIQYNDTNAFGGATYLWYNEVTGTVTANASVASTSTTTGTFIVTGGAGISGALYVGANVTVTGNVLPSANVTYNLGSPTQRWKDLFLAGNTINLSGATISATNGSITFQNSLGGSFSVTGSASGQSTGTFGNIIANSGVASSSTSTGALQVTGGAGISGAVNIGGLLSVAGDATVTGNLTVNGTTTNINTTDLVVEDKNIIIADVASPTNVTADGAGITVKGSTDKTFNWVSLTAAWTSSEDLNLLTGKQYEIAGTSVLTATTLGSAVVNSSLTSLGTITTLVATNSRTTTGVVTNLSSGNIVATNSTSGTWSTANVSLYESVTATTTNAVFYPMMADKTAGNTGGFSAATLTHNPSTGNLTATGHVGNHWGPVAATTANVSSTLAVTGASTLTGNLSVGASASTTRANLYVHGGSLQSGVGNVLTIAEFAASNSNASYLRITKNRVATGADWTTTSTKIQQRIDVTDMGYIEFNPVGASYGIGIGSGATEHIRVIQGGNVVVTTTTASTNTTTGALVVRGGAGIAGAVNAGGNVTVTGYVMPSANLTYDLGSGTTWWRTFYGVSTQAQYADLAENYQADAQYVPGTVLVFGGACEVTTTDQDHNTAVAGIVSTNPAHLMNGMLVGDGVVALGLTGRLPCRVQGPVAKGDVLVTSNTAGVAQRIDNTKFLPGCVVGKALEAINTNTIQTIEVVVGRF